MVENVEAGLRPGRPHLRNGGVIAAGPLALPYSSLASAAARELFLSELDPPPPEIATDMLALREFFGRLNDQRAERMRALFPVEVREDEIGGVRVHVVTPVTPKPANAGRALICLHGGAFTWGAGSGALVEAVPIAGRMGVTVVAVDYRLGPEHRFPAASQDVAAVYRALIARHAPGAVGLYGCSAGAVLTAQAVAWIDRQGLPRPGAIALLGGGAGEMSGDSTYLAPLLEGLASPGGPVRLEGFSYFDGAAFDDPMVAPGAHPDLLKRFPPSLLIAGGRDFALSCVADLHLKLDRAGVEARLYVFDGLWHAFQIFPDLPESQQVYDVMSAFFDRHLDAAPSHSA